MVQNFWWRVTHADILSRKSTPSVRETDKKKELLQFSDKTKRKVFLKMVSLKNYYCPE